MSPARFLWRISLLVAFATASLAVTLWLPPIPQSPSYHRFADQRTLLGVPHLLNVASNLPFVGIGAWGLYNLLVRRKPVFEREWERAPYVVLMGSIFFTGIGSCFYHVAPGDATLFWDRLPLTLTFSSILGILLIERVDAPWGRRLFLPLLLAGAGSLLYWRLGMVWGKGDLRFYGLLQGWAMAGVPLIILLFPSRYTGTLDLIIVVGLYGIAKLFEVTDPHVYRLGEFLSGHTLKHLVAGLATWRLGVMLNRRRVRESSRVREAPFENLVGTLPQG